MLNNEFVELSKKGKVAVLTLNSQERLNAFNKTMRAGLVEATKLIETDDDIRVVVFTGAGRAFSAGADLTEGTAGHASFVEQCAAEYKPWFMAIHDSKKVYIAAINGACAGAASAAAMNCDLIVMADDAYIYQAFSAIGLMPDMGATWLLLHKIGYQRAFEMAISAGRLTAADCLKLGIANKVVSPDRLLPAALEFAKELAKGAPLAQQATKALMRKAMHMSYSEVIDEEARMQSALIDSEDGRNAKEAFLRKEQPVFIGK